MIRIILFSALLIVFVCCGSGNRALMDLNGIWIPVNYKSMQDDFPVVRIYNNNAFLRIKTQNSIVKDSIYMMSEPGFILERGNITYQSEEKYNLKYKEIYRTFKVISGGENGHSGAIDHHVPELRALDSATL